MDARSEGQFFEKRYYPSGQRVAHVRPHHLLMNYFAAMAQPQTDSELRSALKRIEGQLETVRSGVSAAGTTIGSVESEFEAWAKKGLVKWDQKKRVWKVPNHLRDIYESLTPGMNRDLDTEEVSKLRSAIADVVGVT